MAYFESYSHLKTCKIPNDLENIGQGQIQGHQNYANVWLLLLFNSNHVPYLNILHDRDTCKLAWHQMTLKI